VGGVTFGAAGGWIIRASRDQDTRLAGTITGAGAGLGVGLILYSNTDSTGGKIAALILPTLMGGFAGHRLALFYTPKPKKPVEATPTPTPETETPTAWIAPSVTPVIGRTGATGVMIGVQGAMF
jgi:hypothetical protein